MKYFISKLFEYFWSYLLYFTYPKNLEFGNFVFELRQSKLHIFMKYYLSKHINDYERNERLVSLKLLASGDRILEGGTSIGLITGFVSQIVGQEGVIYTFEADQSLKLKAESLNKMNKNIFFFNKALVFDNLTTVTFDKRGWLGGRLGEGKNSLNVSAANIYCVSTEYNLNVWLLDIEGAELGILDHEIPRVVQKIIIELHPSIYGDDMAQNIIKKIISSGFSLVERSEEVYGFRR